jgi:hypothetical protein
MNMSGSIELNWGVVDQAGGTQFFEYASVIILGILALGRVHALLVKIIDEKTPQARSKGVTQHMVRRIDFALVIFLVFLIFGAITPVLRLQDRMEIGLAAELLVNGGLVCLIVLALFMNVGELIDNRTITFDRVWYQVRLLSRRGVDFTSLSTTAVATVLKYQLQGVPVVDSVLRSIQKMLS